MAAPLDIVNIRVDTDGSLDRLRLQMARMPAGVERARKRALRKLSTWVKRQVLRTVAKAVQTTQKRLQAMLRYTVGHDDDGSIIIWIGTNPIGAHNLGTVKWTRRMQGARSGKRLFPGSWSWGDGSRTGKAIMQRTSPEQLPIERVEVEIANDVRRAVNQMMPAIGERFDRLLLQELNYALTVEARA